MDTLSTKLPSRLVYIDQRGQDDIECSIHSLPKQLMREFNHVFGDKYLSPEFRVDNNVELLAMPTNQRAREDLVNIGPHIELEKDRLLNVFMTFGQDICSRIRNEGYWADYIDPCSGLPMLTKSCNKVYSEVDGMEVLLNYRSYNAGFCKILTHPKWGSAVYPATIFLNAPFELVVSIVESYKLAL